MCACSCRSNGSFDNNKDKCVCFQPNKKRRGPKEGRCPLKLDVKTFFSVFPSFFFLMARPRIPALLLCSLLLLAPMATSFRCPAGSISHSAIARVCCSKAHTSKAPRRLEFRTRMQAEEEWTDAEKKIPGTWSLTAKLEVISFGVR